MSEIGDSIGCPSNYTINSTRTSPILVPIQQVYKKC
uniref:Uncharacterized protein MANES_15G026400 n=1 Tax=Rhizophora mucronata TaxID=61149 RepID=A0A2P2LPF5_RHIMU